MGQLRPLLAAAISAGADLPETKSAFRRAILKWVRAPAQRLFYAVWPPTRRSYPAYLAAVVVMYAGLYFGHMRAVRTREAEAEDGRKRDYVTTSMRNLLAYEAAAAPAAAEAVAEGEAKKEGVGAVPEPAAKQAADAKKLCDLLFDDVENGPVTAIGVPADDPDYLAIEQLLKRRAAEELRTTIDRTRAARAAAVGEEAVRQTDGDGVFTAVEYADGGRLNKALEFNKESVAKHFRAAAAPAALLAEAKALAKEIAGVQRQARQRILALVLPHFPKWLCGTLLLMLSETLWGVLHSYTMSLPHTLTAVIDGGTRARAARACLTVGMAYMLNFPIDTLGDVLVDDVEADVQLKLRASVMATVLAQDREYFDAHQVSRGL
jgi:hypothetical protein